MRLDRTIRIEVCNTDNNGCGQRRPIAHQGLCLCMICNSKRLRMRPQSGKSKLKPRGVTGIATGRSDDRFFREIWSERKHFSEVSGEPLGDKFQAVFMSHVLSKQAFPKFRYEKRNIVLMTFAEHRMWSDVAESSPAFQEMFAKTIILRDQLKSEYYQKAVTC